MSNRHTQQSFYRPDIDGLRAIAVIFVIIFHAFPSLIPGGFIGVDIFFVISGFLISGLLYKEIQKGGISLRDFYARRIRRIFPALISVLIFTLIVGWFLELPKDLSQIGKHTIAAAFFASNIVLWREAGYFDSDSLLKPLLHLWSLGIEEQFYLFFPLFLLVLGKTRKTLAGILVLLVISFLVNILLVHEHPKAAFYLPFTRVWELLVGCAISYIIYYQHVITPPPDNFKRPCHSLAWS
ncbi:MAG: acyltransferase [Proteobacteria bacterium]|nr:acyltransferase [Pseudomonadota bacterium]